jgi:hypothetical protein
MATRCLRDMYLVLPLGKRIGRELRFVKHRLYGKLSFHVILRATMSDNIYYPYFTGEETEAHNGTET